MRKDDLLTALAAQLGALLAEQKCCVTAAESCTGGGISEAITRIAGSSEWFEAGFVTYSNAQKTAQLGVAPTLFEQVGAVSREVVLAMVKGACSRSGADFGVAVSGIAGPGGGSPDKPVGTVWLAWQLGDQAYSQCCLFKGDRDAVRSQTIRAALMGLIALAQGKNPLQG